MVKPQVMTARTSCPVPGRGVVEPEEHREGEHHGEGARFPHPLHIDPPGAERGQPQRAHAHHQLAGQHEDQHPARRGAVDEQPDRAGDQQHPVGDRVEDLADLRALVEVPGDVAVDPVGGAEDREQDPGRDRPVVVEQQPEEPRAPRAGGGPRSGSGSSRDPDRGTPPP